MRGILMGLTFITLALMPILSSVASRAASADASEQARIEQAIQAYENTRQAAEAIARGKLVAAKNSELLHDPLTQAIGNPEADVVIIEFFDYACPFCKAAEPRLEALLKTDKGVKLVVKEFPILTAESIVASKAALASVKQGKYAEFHQAMMMFKGQLQNATIFEIAKDVGLDVDRLRKDMLSPEVADEIIANFNLARSLRIFDTPNLIVAGQILTEPSAKIDFPKVVAAARTQ